MELGPVCTPRRAGQRPRAAGVFSWLLLALVVPTGCATVGDDPARDAPVRYATYSDTTALGEGDGAVLDGTLTTHGGCLVVETGDGSVVVPVLPSSETTWDDGAERLAIGSAGHHVGDTVSFGGGYAADTSAFDLPDACAEVDAHFLVSTP